MSRFDEILAAIDQFLWAKIMRPRLAYLSQSHDLIDLEQRMRRLDAHRGRFPG